MSTIAHKPRTVPTRLRRKASVWLAGAIPLLVVAIVFALTVTGSDTERTVPAPSPSQAAPGTRYDGGPNEGTRGFPAYPSPERYDGGPEEGTADVTPPGPQPSSPPDEGPGEGSHLRGPGARTK
jgi:hypothetical protein